MEEKWFTVYPVRWWRRPVRVCAANFSDSGSSYYFYDAHADKVASFKFSEVICILADKGTKIV